MNENSQNAEQLLTVHEKTTDPYLATESDPAPLKGKEIKEADDTSSVSDIEKIPENERKTFLKRYFSKMGPGSLRGSIFNLSIVSIGIGALTLPKTYADLGLFASLIFTVFFAFASYWTLNMIVYAARKSDLVIYGQVCEHYLGKAGSYVYDIANIILLFGVITVYQIIRKLVN